MKAIPWPPTGKTKIGAGCAMITAFCVATVAGGAAYAEQGAKKYPEGVSPSDVFESVDLLNRSVDFLLEAKRIKAPPRRPSLETGLGPFHVYQIQLACIERLHKYQRQTGVRPIPLVTSVPMKYVPADVKKLADLMIQKVRKLASQANVQGLPEQVNEVAQKTPTDVVVKCFDLRREINQLRGTLGLGTTPVPTLRAGQQMTTADVFLQTQILTAELNLLKMKLDTASSTPLAIPVEDKTPTDVHQRVAFLQYLIPQVRSLQNLVAKADEN